jgi:hypothetical protein
MIELINLSTEQLAEGQSFNSAGIAHNAAIAATASRVARVEASKS